MERFVFVGSLAILMATAAYGYTITHPNLQDAYSATEQAIQHIQAAQQANKGIEFGGHADNALTLLKKVETELIEGDQYNNAHKKK
jgi:hypothetical protein